jgi:hypothetical protein
LLLFTMMQFSSSTALDFLNDIIISRSCRRFANRPRQTGGEQQS